MRKCIFKRMKYVNKNNKHFGGFSLKYKKRFTKISFPTFDLKKVKTLTGLEEHLPKNKTNNL